MPGIFREPYRAIGGPVVDPETLRQHRDLFVGVGVAFVLLGMLAVGLPIFFGVVTTILIGWVMVIAGLVEGYHSIRARGWASSGWEMLSAVVQVVAGLFLVVFPVAGKLILTLVLAAYFLAEGILKLIRARQHRGMEASSWMVFDGILSMALGLLLIVRWPSIAVWVIGLLVAVNLIAGGSSMLLLGLAARPRRRAGL